MLKPAEVRKLAKSKFDSSFRFNDKARESVLTWSIWKQAFDAGFYASRDHDAKAYLESLIQFKRSIRLQLIEALNDASIFEEDI